MELEFDPAKSDANRAKHGIDFVAAQELGRAGNGLTIDARSHDEVRYRGADRRQVLGGVLYSPAKQDPYNFRSQGQKGGEPIS